MAPKIPVNLANGALSKDIDKRLKFYATAAIAASVGLLALAEPAESKVVITNTNIPFPLFGGKGQSLDLNHDGVPDVLFVSSYSAGYGHETNRLSVRPYFGGGVKEKAHTAFASALARSAKIGPSAYFANGAEMESQFCEGSTTKHCQLDGNWGGNHPNRFLGVKFLIQGTTHYGWVRVTVVAHANVRLSGAITEYGYETIPNKRVLAGVPSNNNVVSEVPAGNGRNHAPSLGMLALGASGLTLWKREDEIVNLKRK
jgi:hypothetical protein